MYRLVIVFGILAALVAGQCDLAFARSKEVRIGPRNGGYLFIFISQAKQMISTGNSYRVMEDQYSAAAMQVLFIERRYPNRICASPLAKLHFHQAFDPTTKATIKIPSRWFTTFIGKANLRRLGPLPEYGEGFKTVRATEYLGRCKAKAIACNITWCGW